MISPVFRRRAVACAGGLLLACLGLPFAGPAAADALYDLGPPFIQLEQPAAPGPVESSPGDGRTTFLAQFAAGRYADAVGTAQSRLAQVRAKEDAGDTQILQALMDLGASQHHGEDYAGAINSYTQALRIAESSPNLRDARIAPVLHGLGVAQFAAGNYGAAVETLQRGVFLTRANAGLYSLEQLKYYDALNESYLAAGLYSPAIAREKVRIAVVQRTTGLDSPESFAAIEQAAQLYRRMDKFYEERVLRLRQLRQLEKLRGYDDPSLVPVLIGIAATYRLGFELEIITVRPNERVVLPINDRFPVIHLQRAMDILETHPGPNSVDDQVTVLVELGDYHITFGEPGRAARFYRSAYALLEESGNTERIQTLFSNPVPVFIPRPEALPGVGDQPAAGLPEGKIVFEFNLGSTGRPQSRKVIEVMPTSASLMRIRADRSLRLGRFRPVIGPDGPERSEGVRYALPFNYKPAS